MFYHVVVNLETLGEVIHHDGTFLSITCKKQFHQKRQLNQDKYKIHKTLKTNQAGCVFLNEIRALKYLSPKGT